MYKSDTSEDCYEPLSFDKFNDSRTVQAKGHQHAWRLGCHFVNTAPSVRQTRSREIFNTGINLTIVTVAAGQSPRQCYPGTREELLAFDPQMHNLMWLYGRQTIMTSKESSTDLTDQFPLCCANCSNNSNAFLAVCNPRRFDVLCFSGSLLSFALES